MANETLITDLVAQQALDQLEQLDRAMEGTLTQFQDCARQLAQGLKIPVEVTGDVDALRTLTNTVMRDAQQATQQLTQQLQQQQQVVANTTNTISRQLQAQENLNKAQREAFEQDQEAQQLAKALLGTRQQNYELLARYTAEMKANKDAQKQVNEQEKQGLITQEQAIQKRATLMAAYDKTKFAAQELTKILAAENKEANAVQGSYQQLSQKLERLKMAYKQMNDAQKASAGGKELEKEIQNLDAHLKDLSADMGEHQRNVGNYAIAAQNMKGTLRELTEEIAQLTLQYNELSDEEQKSDIGMQMRDKITELTEQAGKYKDIISDVKQSISGSASDTRLFDSLIEAGQVFAATMGVAETACRALGMSEDSLQQSMLKVQQAMQAVQALQVIQNTLQKQSNLMKGIAIIQSKAAAAAAKVEAAATASATGATKAQTIAQAAFNAVAKANPYVLLATAILTVIGLIVGYTSATKDAAAADEEAKKAADERKESMDNMAESFGNTAGEMIAKYKLMQEQWNALGDDLKAKRQYLVQNQQDFDSIAQAAWGASAKVADVNTAEKLIHDNTGKVEKAIKRRAMAMAAYAEYVRITQQELQELEKLSTFSYRVYKQGERINADVMNEMIRHGASRGAFTKENDAIDPETGSVIVHGGYIINDAGAATAASRAMGNEQALKQQEEVRKRYEAQRERAWKRFVDSGGLEPANFRGGGGGGGGGNKPSSTTPSRASSGSSGGSTNKSESVKEAEDIKKEIDAIILQAIRGQVDVAKEGTDEWAQYQKEALREQAEADKVAVEDKRVKTLEELKKTHDAGKISEDEYNQQLNYLNEASRQVKLNIEKKLAEDIKEVDEEVTRHKESLADEEVEKLANAAAAKQLVRDQEYQKEIKELYDEYTEALKTAHKKGQDTTKVTEFYNKKKEEIDNKYANDTVEATIKALEEELKVANLSTDERERLQKELTQATIQLAEQRAEQEKKSIEDVVAADKEAREKRNQNLQDWVQRAGEAIDKIGELIGAMYDNQIAKVEELINEEQQRYEAEVNHIDWLADRGAITTEEAEIRKRDAAEATAKKQEALEKKKASYEYKKAVVQKANQIAQIGINTALGIMSALAMFPPNIPLSVFVGAMGAIQLATALAQPIKAYAEGTKGKGHPGGLAIVGDAGKSEVVMLGKRAWITPDSPTLLDLPKGAEVLPDASKVNLMQMGSSLFMSLPRSKGASGPIIVNDYEALEGRMANNTKVLAQGLARFEHSVKREMRRQKFNAYINSRT